MKTAKLTAMLLVLGAASMHAAEPQSIPLLDGKTLSGWVNDKLEPAKLDAGWTYDADGTLHLKAGSKAGNLLSEKEYGSFILDWEWKVAPGGNNGVKYRVKKYEKGGWLGIEYQMIDDVKHPDGGKGGGTHTTASLYDIYAPAADKPLNPAGEWNTSRIVLKGNKVEHYLNGKKVAEAEIGSSDWREHVAKSKFAKQPNFGENARGRIMITYHNDETWYRNMRIQPLD